MSISIISTEPDGEFISGAPTLTPLSVIGSVRLSAEFQATIFKKLDITLYCGCNATDELEAEKRVQLITPRPRLEGIKRSIFKNILGRRLPNDDATVHIDKNQHQDIPFDIPLEAFNPETRNSASTRRKWHHGPYRFIILRINALANSTKIEYTSKPIRINPYCLLPQLLSHLPVFREKNFPLQDNGFKWAAKTELCEYEISVSRCSLAPEDKFTFAWRVVPKSGEQISSVQIILVELLRGIYSS